jgi:hypothetical protein
VNFRIIYGEFNFRLYSSKESYRLYKKDYETEEEPRAQQKGVELLMNN